MINVKFWWKICKDVPTMGGGHCEQLFCPDPKRHLSIPSTDAVRLIDLLQDLLVCSTILPTLPPHIDVPSMQRDSWCPHTTVRAAINSIYQQQQNSTNTLFHTARSNPSPNNNSPSTYQSTLQLNVLMCQHTHLTTSKHIQLFNHAGNSCRHITTHSLS